MTRAEAQVRNHNIMRLKGMHANAKILLDPDLATVVTAAVNTQLIKMGATTPEQDIAKWRKERGL